MENREMSTKTESTSSRPPEIPENDWKISLYDPGDNDDCPRACFLPCDMFAHTRYRLDLIKQGRDPLDLTDYKDFNPTCWKFFGLCTGGFCIGSGIYTGRETTRIRQKYGIKGTAGDDMTRGIFCQPCSLIRNDLEIRQREGMKQEADLPPPRPLGEDYQPIFAIKPDGYKSEPRMTTPRGILKPITSPESSSPPDGQPALREVHFHEPGQGNAPNVAASYPAEVGHVSQSSFSPRTEGGPSIVNQRRSREGTLTPIEEADHQAGEERKKSTILGPAMNTFQRTTSPPVMHVTTSDAPIQAPTPTRDHDRYGNGRGPDTDRLEAPVRSRESPSKTPTGSTNARSSEDQPDRLEAPNRPLDSTPIPQRSRDIRLSEDGSDEAPAHFPVIEARVPSPELSRKAPKIGKSNTPVRKSRFSEEFDAPSADEIFSNIPDVAPSSSLDAPPRLPHLPGAFDTPAMPPATVPAGSSNVPSQLPQLPGAFPSSSHSETPNMKPSALEQLTALGDVANQSPKVVTVEEAETSIAETIEDEVDEAQDEARSQPYDVGNNFLPPQAEAHELSTDTVVPLLDQPKAHGPHMDAKVALAAARIKDHPIESDPRINSPKPISIRNHQFTEDKRLAVPRSDSPFKPGIHLDQRVPTPPALVRPHNRLEDRQIATPSPSADRENRNLGADVRTASPGLGSRRGGLTGGRPHSLRHDSRVGTPKHLENVHDLAADVRAPTGSVSPLAKSPEPRSPPPKRPAAASPALSASSISIGTRAHQLLEHFLEGNRKGAERESGNKSTPTLSTLPCWGVAARADRCCPAVRAEKPSVPVPGAADLTPPTPSHKVDNNNNTTTMSEQKQTVHIGTRRSALALRQVDLVIAALQPHHPNVHFQVHALATLGDKNQTASLPSLGKGLWTNELEAKLFNKEVDFIVHCLKDMPTTLPEGGKIGVVTEREDPRDVVVMKKKWAEQGKYKSLADLPEGAIVGTSSVRRAAQLRRRYPGLVFKDVRGNIETRMRKCDEEDYDCIILAAAGLLRMGYDERIAQWLDSTTEGGGMLHAVGQGALAMEIREGDDKTLEIIKPLCHEKTMVATFAERAVMRSLEGGCSVPIGVETKWVGEDQLQLKVTVVSLDGKESVDGQSVEVITTIEEAEAMGQKLAEDLAKRGAQKILDFVNQGRASGGALKIGDL
ncbi:porphobilinogen deaminase, dipyromethane cofactor binding domain-containing protein [Neurospora hispaniola]|uniref:Porphobilinogen deaminase n=1 Tax=Neurospora hispaniola TaxID=588809 RepID=A0AAJ0IEK7_9PEZI|nr:porphobilinogen deaminase, dipyromethane cofactor binding domain-containing protein [Neurospora hispaniola]